MNDSTNSEAEMIIPLPREGVEDSGPQAGLDGFEWIVVVIFIAGFIGIIAAIIDAWPNDQYSISFIFIVFVSLAIAYFVAYQWNKRRKTTLPSARDILRQDLDFDPHVVLKGVQATAFFRPFTIGRGGSVVLFIAAQNLMSRTRLVEIKYPDHPLFGALAEQKIVIRLGPGQAMIYRQPFEGNQEVQSDYTGRLSFICDTVTGPGARIVATNREERAAFGAIGSLRLFLEVSDTPALTAQTSLDLDENGVPRAQCFSLYVPGMAEPRMSVMEALAATPPHQRVDVRF